MPAVTLTRPVQALEFWFVPPLVLLKVPVKLVSEIEMPLEPAVVNRPFASTVKVATWLESP